ncbi:Uma2 family endonuclease [Actinoplanes octamycinicus]|uniref:Uma2 family endonuclease n=1 Tax=Actinoplanes octamycinicus TaxID=135948 RepID=A0A7W7GSB6_9ACTN|nr:Uma2 family endonuclease [Actinoplanes octamycinicus]MBB4737367.1 Uma2 family endonuclease [Actinoplanes octamycinicus]
MTSAIFTNGRPLTEPEFLAIGETPERIELFDGSLYVSPGPTPIHQHVSTRLAVRLIPAVEEAGLHLHEAVNLRLRPDRIPIADLVITTDIDYYELVIDSSAARLVCEIISPSNSTTDRVLKMSYYAEAGIPWYLLVDPRTGELRLYGISDGEYVLHATAEPGVPLQLTDPVRVAIDPAELLPPQ